MPDYRYLACDWLTGDVRAEIPFSTIKMAHVRNGAGPMSATVDQRHVKATRTNLDPGRTIILLERDDRIIADALLWGAKPGAGGNMNCSGASLWSLFARRHITSNRTYADIDQLEVARDLIAWAQGTGSTAHGNAGDPAGNYNIDVDDTLSGVATNQDYPGHQLKNLGQAVEQLASAQGGFDFDIDVRWSADRATLERTFQTWYPRRGRRTNLVLELGTNIEDYTLGVDAGSQAIRVHGVGAGEGFDMGRTTVTDANLLGAYPLTETVVTHKDADTLAKLVGHTQARLASRRLPVVSPQLLNVKIGKQLQVGSWVVGDEATLRIDDGWAQVDSIFRIEGWSIHVDQNGKETVDMDLIETEAIT